MTRWAAEVRPDLVLPEYPRPQMVRDRWLNLNGLWDYAITAKDAGRPAAWDGRSSSRSPSSRPYRASASPSGPPRPSGIDGRSSSPRTGEAGGSSFISERSIGSARSGSTAARPGPTAAATTPSPTTSRTPSRGGAKQEIVLRVFDPTDDDNSAIARGKQVMKPHGIFYTAVTGIWQTVWLEPVPDASLPG